MSRQALRESWLRRLTGRSLPLESETSFFVLASVLDVVMTWTLLNQGMFFERNPIARFFLDHWGFRGMIWFKFTLVAFVTVLAQCIALRREDTARWLLNAGTMIVGAVVVYSFGLYVRTLSGI